jgi:hypothetical protein
MPTYADYETWKSLNPPAPSPLHPLIKGNISFEPNKPTSSVATPQWTGDRHAFHYPVSIFAASHGRKDSLTSCSTQATLYPASDLSALCFPTGKVRTAALAPRHLGRRQEPLSGVLADDRQHPQATHTRIYETTQNISSSFFEGTMTRSGCSSGHPFLFFFF